VLYPVTSKYAAKVYRGIMPDDTNGQPPLPFAPTWAAPGTEEKIAAMQERLLSRVALFHPTDGHERY
jgi:predicted YcjX-like family ATPase